VGDGVGRNRRVVLPRAVRTRTRVTSVTVDQAREHGVQWGMLVCPDLTVSESQLLIRLEHLATHAADVCQYIEGVNEPNYVRGGGNPPATGQGSLWRSRG
jgi:hypothetical protein